jgi:hypothetical protein
MVILFTGRDYRDAYLFDFAVDAERYGDARGEPFIIQGTRVLDTAETDRLINNINKDKHA